MTATERECIEVEAYFNELDERLDTDQAYYSEAWGIDIDRNALSTMIDNYRSWSEINGMTRREAYEFCIQRQILETMTPVMPMPF